jgi:hypothetical protein
MSWMLLSVNESTCDSWLSPNRLLRIRHCPPQTGVVRKGFRLCLRKPLNLHGWNSRLRVVRRLQVADQPNPQSESLSKQETIRMQHYKETVQGQLRDLAPHP